MSRIQVTLKWTKVFEDDCAYCGISESHLEHIKQNIVENPLIGDRDPGDPNMRLYSAWRYVIQFGSWPKDEIVVLCRLFDGREPPSAMSIEARKLMKELALELAKSAAKKTVGL